MNFALALRQDYYSRVRPVLKRHGFRFGPMPETRDPARMVEGGTTELMLYALRHSVKPMRSTELRDALGVKPSAARAALLRLRDLGLAEQVPQHSGVPRWRAVSS